MSDPDLFGVAGVSALDDALDGEVKAVVYEDDTKPWRVLRMRAGETEFVAVGRFARVSVGDRLRIVGRAEDSQRYGPRVVMSSYLELEPDTLDALVRYLGGGRFPGVGETSARRVVEAFGLETLAVLDGEPQRLATVSGLGKKRALALGRAWTELRESRDLELLLTRHGLGGAIARRIREKYGGRAADLVRHDPFRLAREVSGVGFRTADALARSLGLAGDSAARVMAGVFHALVEARDDGHTCLPEHEVFAGARTLLAVDGVPPDEQALSRALDALVDEGALFIRTQFSLAHYAHAGLARSEASIAGDVARLLTPAEAPLAPLQPTLARLRSERGLELGDEQLAAMERARTERFLVLTGGPGCGKTTLLRALLLHYETHRLRVTLAAPTGRAARRMAEATGHEARTIHRLLALDPRRGLTRGSSSPLEGDVFVFDESSMLDVTLAAALLAAIPDGARVLLVGDVDQLPSVGPGSVLRDLIDSGRVPVARLSRVYRQAEASLIVTNAYRIKHGHTPLSAVDRDDGQERDYFFVAREGSEAIAASIGTLVADRIPKRFGLDPRRDIQVLVPMHKGAAGTKAMNLRLQALLNPAGDSVQRGDKVLRVGDRVLQLVNDSKKQLANGDQGTIARLDRDAQAVIVRFEDGEGSRELAYELADLDQLALAYACTIHKSQGSEFPAVVVAVAREHALMLRRNLLYTAFTRARRLLVVVGEERALELALRDDRIEARHTALRSLLDGAAPSAAP